MRIGLQSWGTEGDLRPFLALGAELRRRGAHLEVCGCLDDTSMRGRASALSAALRNERGAERAAELVERAGARTERT